MGATQAHDQSRSAKPHLAISAEDLISQLDALATPANVEILQSFFKTGPGEYGEGDTFIGIKMPVLRSAVKPFRDLPLDEIAFVLSSPIHEHRTAALVILSEQAKAAKKRGDTAGHKRLYDFYLAHTATINNWDLVDVSCRDVVGEYLLTKQNDKPLRRLAKSNEMWERRIGIVSTWSFIRAGELTPTFEISEMLLEDPHDLMHKATGWMLREAGKKDEAALEAFLSRFAHRLPRTALRYSIERMTPERRKYWLAYAG